MAKRLGLYLALFLIFPTAARAVDLDLTTRLLTAKPGSWVRRHAPRGHAITQYVADVTDEAVTVRVIRDHDDHVVDNLEFVIPKSYIKENGANPDAPDAKAGKVTYHDVAYNVKVVKVKLDDSDGLYYISDAVPANGIVRIDILSAGSDPTILWMDSHGTEPDNLILNAGEGKPANEEYGIPEP